jgi:glycosyltransferase involved in cell wall biosynthesis
VEQVSATISRPVTAGPTVTTTTEQVATPRVSVVIPARNEARNLPFVFETIPADVFEIIVVDGHSADGTAEVARELDPRTRVFRQTGRGKGDALQTGFAAVRGDVIVMLDADCSADGGEIPKFVSALTAGADFAKGTRYADGGGSEDITLLRSTGNRVLTAQVNALYGTRYTDLCYGYNAFWRHCLPHIAVDCPGFEVETLVMCRLAKARLDVREVGSFEWNRKFGESNLNTFRDGWRVQRTIVKELFRSPRIVAQEGPEPQPLFVERRASARGSALPAAVERRAYFRHASS